MNVVVWGCGEYGKKYCEYVLQNIDVNLVGIADNNHESLNQKINNGENIFENALLTEKYHHIFSAEEVQKLYWDKKIDYVLIGVRGKYFQEVHRQLLEWKLPISSTSDFIDPKNMDNYKEEYYIGRNNIRVSVLENMCAAHYLQGDMVLVYNEQGKFLIDSYNYLYKVKEPIYDSVLVLNEKNIVQVDECCVLARDWTKNYGHFIFEVLDKIQLMEESGYSGKYIIYETTFARDFIKLYGIDEGRVLWINESNWNTKYFIRKLHSVESIYGQSYKTTQASIRFVDKIINKLVWKKPLQEYPKRIYVKRIGGRKVLGLDKILEKYGFETIIPEDLTLEEEIKYFHAADVVVSPHGSNSMNAVYMRNETYFIETFGSGYINPCSLGIIAEKNIKYNMLVERCLREGEINADYTIENSDFALVMQNILGKKDEEYFLGC